MIHTNNDPIGPVAANSAVAGADNSNAARWRWSIYRVDPTRRVYKAVDNYRVPGSVEVPKNPKICNSPKPMANSRAQRPVCSRYASN